jgi:spore germination cell wall hydrolase CwlJ-like protein
MTNAFRYGFFVGAATTSWIVCIVVGFSNVFLSQNTDGVEDNVLDVSTVSPIRVDLNQKDVDLVAAILIAEAGGEGREGMIAVMNVINNRATNNKSYRDVVLAPYQFSCVNDYTTKRKPPAYQSLDRFIDSQKNYVHFIMATSIVRGVMLGEIPDNTFGATHYYNPRKVTPYWTHPEYGGQNPKADRTVTISNHWFFKNVD